MPSSDLLKTLLSEPINSWRNTCGDDVQSTSNKLKRDTSNCSVSDVDAISIRSDTSGCSERSLGTKIQDMAQNGFIKKQTEEKKGTGMVLTPGITGKPPLPRKFESVSKKNFQENKCKNDSDYSSGTSSPQSGRLEFPNYTDDFKDTHFDYSNEDLERFLKNDELKLTSINASKNFRRETEESRNKSKTGDSARKSPEENPIQYQNWMVEETTKLETETDLYLKDLKKKTEEIHETNEEKKLVASEELDLKFQNFFRREPSFHDPKLQNISEKLKREQDLNRTKTKPKQKPILKKQPKQKFLAKPMRNYQEYKEEEKPEIESWMSKNNETDEIWPKEVKSVNRPNYLEVLDSLNELEEAVKINEENEILADVPEQDNEKTTDDQNDDISSILEVLEAEDKKSREQNTEIYQTIQLKNIFPLLYIEEKIETIKEIVHSELTSKPTKIIEAKKEENVSTISLASSNYK